MKTNKRRSKTRSNETLNRVSISAFPRPEMSGGELLTNVRVPRGVRQIEMVPLKSLKKTARNARTHSKKQIEQIANSIVRFGFITPIVVDSRNGIRAGFGRAQAAELIGLKIVPVIRVTDLSDTELRAFMLADNRIAEGAGWDKELLAIELDDLQIALPEVGLDLSITGFEPGQVDSIISDFGESQLDRAEDIPDIEQIATANPGDLFQLGNHRLLVGDARNSKDYTIFREAVSMKMGISVPIGPNHILQVIPAHRSCVAIVRNGSWWPNIERYSIDDHHHKQFLDWIASYAQHFIIGPNERSVEHYRQAYDPTPVPLEPIDLGFPPSAVLRKWEMEYFQFLSRLSIAPASGASNMLFDFDQGAKLVTWQLERPSNPVK